MTIENDFQRVYGTIKETEDRLKALIAANAHSYLWRLPTNAAAHPLNNVPVNPSVTRLAHNTEVEVLRAENELLKAENERLQEGIKLIRAVLVRVRDISTEATPEAANR